MAFTHNSTFWYNNEQELFIKDVFHYDIPRCIPTIFAHYNIDYLLDLPKKESLIKVGYKFKNNKKLFNFIEFVIRKSINRFLHFNNIEKEDIINILKDGMLIKTYINNINYDFKFKPKFRDKFDYYLSYGSDRKKYLLFNKDKSYVLKGMNHYPRPLMEDFISNLIIWINILDERRRNQKIQKYIYDFYNNIKDIKYYQIKEDDKFGYYTEDGYLTLHKNLNQNVDGFDADIYMNLFIRPFLISFAY